MTGRLGDALPLDAEGHRRYLTLLFSDLSDSTRLGELMEAEDYAELLADLRALCREIIVRHGGHIARMQGDGVLALFGYPAPHEDDGRRATDAALELHAAVSALASRGPDGAPLTLHSGIHAGLVLLSDGDLERGRFELLGNVPNVAARLSTIAEADDVLVSEETLGPQARFFITSERIDLQVKGRAAPVAAFRVLGRAASHNRFDAMSRHGLCPFVGREHSVRQLREHLRRATTGPTQCVALCGGPGMGKTRLVEELLRHASATRCRVLRGYCESYLSAEPLQPFVQMLRTVQGSDADGPGLAEALEHAARGGPAAMGGLFDALAARQPLLLVIDDWQWADEASLRTLDVVLALQRPVCVLLVSRSAPEGLPSQAVVIDLLPLNDLEAAEVVRHLLPNADPFVAAEIHRYAGGIPLFIEELCHSAAAQGPRNLLGLHLGDRAWLDSLIESRVGRLPAEQARLVRAAAVIGNVFPGWLLERITGQAADSPAVQALAAQDFVFPGEQAGTLRFKHGITRDAVYEAVGLHERKAMHRRIAQALHAQAESGAADDLLEALAYHCAAGDLPRDAAQHAERAGDKAMAASALDRARAQYAAALRALDATAPLDRERQLRWCAVAQKLGMACVFDPLALADGLATFERGVALARASGDLQALARAEYWLGYLCYAKGLSRPAVAHCEASLDLAAQLDDARLAAQVRATLGQALLSACRYDRALGLLDAALDSKRRQGHPGNNVAVGSAYALACKGYLLGDRGHFAGADECFAEALQLLGDVRHQVAASVRHWVSVVRQWQGRWEEALRAAEEAAEIAEQVKSRQQLAMGRALAGHARWMIARDPLALQAVRDATVWIEARKGGLATSLNHGWLVEGALAEGRTDEARRHAARLLLRARHDDRIGEALGCRALAQAASATGDFARAAHWLGVAQRSAEIRGSAHERAANALCEAQLELDRGRAGEARRLLDAACVALEAMRMRWHLERAQRMVAAMVATAGSATPSPASPRP
jgi:class 3 adenylate cyclase/tetratricopeptide (TPR) repeat protein